MQAPRQEEKGARLERGRERVELCAGKRFAEILGRANFLPENFTVQLLTWFTSLFHGSRQGVCRPLFHAFYI